MPQPTPASDVTSTQTGNTSFTETSPPSQTATNTSTQSPEPTNTSTPIILLPTFTPTPTLTFTPSPPPEACIPEDAEIEYGLVLWVSDGDTIVVDIQGQRSSVRYLGIDAPASGTQSEPFGAQAKALNDFIVAHQVAHLFRDVSGRDSSGQLLRYVIVNNIFLNYELVRQGLASVSISPPDTACDEVFQRAEQMASQEGKGIWSIPPNSAQETVSGITPPYVIPARIFRFYLLRYGILSESSSKSITNNCDTSYPTVCIPPPPPYLSCDDIPYRYFRVWPPDPHRFDGDHDGIGCET